MVHQFARDGAGEARAKSGGGRRNSWNAGKGSGERAFAREPGLDIYASRRPEEGAGAFHGSAATRSGFGMGASRNGRSAEGEEFRISLAAALFPVHGAAESASAIWDSRRWIFWISAGGQHCGIESDAGAVSLATGDRVHR